MAFFTSRDGTSLFYNDWGTGKPVVLLGTAMMSSRMWEFQAPCLAAHGFRCVTYDRRGCGRSDQPWEGYDYDTLADDLAALLHHLDLVDVTLVGYAVGGGEAVRYLSRHGTDRVSRLALVSSTTPFMMKTPDNPEGLDPEFFEGLAEGMVKDRPRWAAELATQFFGGADAGPDRSPLSPELTNWLAELALDCSPRAAVEIYRTLFTTDQRSETAEITLPTLIAHGTADAGAPFRLCGEATAALIPGSAFIRYEGAAHGLFATHADRFNADLLAFLAK
ncbi:alpha/beta fold hydrolase [Streptomyces sp. NPDC048157]|uniref:alpha/beta fold hydrolase n=1 Tax=unclassified Streptomyces TaxID=2593676 RepID=UPI00371E21F4